MRSQNTISVHAGRSDFQKLGVHAPPIDLSTTTPLGDIDQGGDSYENLASGGILLDGQPGVYRRLWNPTVARFEEAVSALEANFQISPYEEARTFQGVSFSTGMAALTAVLLSQVKSGKPHIIAVRPMYGGSDHLLKTNLLGTKVSYARVEEVESQITSETGLIIVESPANPTLELVDIRDLVAHSHSVPVLVDNTFATPILQQPLSLGATYVLYSATKYIGGHGDAMSGIVITNEERASDLRRIRAITGALLDPFSAFLLHRGIQTLPIRIREQQRNAIALAEWFKDSDAIVKIYFPGTEAGDRLGLVGRQMSGPGAVLSIELKAGKAAAASLCKSLKLVTHAVSLGGTDSLIQHPAALTHRPVEMGAKPPLGLLRISVGLEDIEDIVEDFAQALRQIQEK